MCLIRHNETVCFINLFLEAEEKVNKTKEEYAKVKEKEESMIEEIDKLRKKLGFYENKIQNNSAFKKNKGESYICKIKSILRFININ